MAATLGARAAARAPPAMARPRPRGRAGARPGAGGGAGLGAGASAFLGGGAARSGDTSHLGSGGHSRARFGHRYTLVRAADGSSEIESGGNVGASAQATEGSAGAADATSASELPPWSAMAFPFLVPALGGLLFGYDIGATSGAVRCVRACAFAPSHGPAHRAYEKRTVPGSQSLALSVHG